MNEKTIKVTLENARKWYTSRNKTLKELALQVFTKEELKNSLKDSLPKTWEEFCEKNTSLAGNYYIKVGGEIIVIAEGGRDRDKELDKSCFPSRKSAEAHIALIQLEQLRDCYRNGWIPDWTEGSIKYSIINYNTEITCGSPVNVSRFISFQTQELCDKFLINFKDLIEKAKDLI